MLLFLREREREREKEKVGFITDVLESGCQESSALSSVVENVVNEEVVKSDIVEMMNGHSSLPSKTEHVEPLSDNRQSFDEYILDVDRNLSDSDSGKKLKEEVHSKSSQR